MATATRQMSIKRYYDNDFSWESLAAEVKNQVGDYQAGAGSSADGTSGNKMWHLFHQRHEGKFFKQRNYVLRAFPVLCACASYSPLEAVSSELEARSCTSSVEPHGGDGVTSRSRSSPVAGPFPVIAAPLPRPDTVVNILELGCGNGSNVFPILEKNASAVVYASDVTPAALRTLMNFPTYPHLSRWASSSTPSIGQHDNSAASDTTLPRRADAEAVPTSGAAADLHDTAHSDEGRLIPFLFDIVKDGLPDAIQVGRRPMASSPSAAARAAAPTKVTGGKQHSRSDESLSRDPAAGDSAAPADVANSTDAGQQPSPVCSTVDAEARFNRIPAVITAGSSMDAVLMTFVLSALQPTDHLLAIKHALRQLKPGGVLCFRDYGLYDLAQVRAPPGSRLGQQLYVRGDGTLTYYFEINEVRTMLVEAGFEAGSIDIRYCTVENVNRKTGLVMKRVWVNATARRPIDVRILM